MPTVGYIGVEMCPIALFALKNAFVLFTFSLFRFLRFNLKLPAPTLRSSAFHYFISCLSDRYLNPSISALQPVPVSCLAVQRSPADFLCFPISFDFFLWYAFMGLSWRLGWSITFVPLSNYAVLRPLSFLHLVGGLRFASSASLNLIFTGLPLWSATLKETPIKDLDLG